MPSREGRSPPSISAATRSISRPPRPTSRRPSPRRRRGWRLPSSAASGSARGGRAPRQTRRPRITARLRRNASPSPKGPRWISWKWTWAEPPIVQLRSALAGDVQPDQVHRLIESGLALVQHIDSPEPDAALLAERLKLWGSAGRAAEVLTHCRPLEAVAHVVEFNVPADALTNLEDILQMGRQRLATIPGVSRVATGEAVAADARYRYCWIITFANEQVMRYYRDHPLHVEFADHHFRPIAEDRVTIDFRLTGG